MRPSSANLRSERSLSEHRLTQPNTLVRARVAVLSTVILPRSWSVLSTQRSTVGSGVSLAWLAVSYPPDSTVEVYAAQIPVQGEPSVSLAVQKWFALGPWQHLPGLKTPMIIQRLEIVINLD